MERYDVLVSPTSGTTAATLQNDTVITSKEAAARLPYMRTNTFNLGSAPAISVPCGFSSQGLPIGLQIGSRSGGDEAVTTNANAPDDRGVSSDGGTLFDDGLYEPVFAPLVSLTDVKHPWRTRILIVGEYDVRS